MEGGGPGGGGKTVFIGVVFRGGPRGGARKYSHYADDTANCAAMARAAAAAAAAARPLGLLPEAAAADAATDTDRLACWDRLSC